MSSESRIPGWSSKKPLLLRAWRPSVHYDEIFVHYDGISVRYEGIMEHYDGIMMQYHV